jgi:sugar phosphate isomerase/epimerase
MSVSRRSFLRAAGAGAGVVALPRLGHGAGNDAANGEILSRLGVALYTVREPLKAKPKETLKAIADIGYRYIEGGNPEVWKAAKEVGLKQVSDYAPNYLVTGNRAAWSAPEAGGLLPESYTWEKAVDEAKARGLEYFIVVYLQKAERGGLDVYKGLAAKLNRAGEVCRKAGIQLGYHPHAFEYETMGGGRPIDVLLKETDPTNLALELDVFWSSIAGVSPLKMLADYKGRVPLLHMKDLTKGTAVQYDETKVPQGAFTEVGNGSVDFAAVLKAAPVAGARYYYVEQDYSTGDPLDSLRTSYATLKKLTGGKA